MKKRSIQVSGHATSISMEPEFWAALKDIAQEQCLSLNQLVSDIDTQKTRANLSSAIRVYVLEYTQNRQSLTG